MKRGYRLPLDPDSTEFECYRVFVPKDEKKFYLAALVGALSYFANWTAWERGGVKGAIAAKVWKIAFNMTLEGLEGGCMENCNCENLEERIYILEQTIQEIKKMCDCQKKCYDPCKEDLPNDDFPGQDTGGELPSSICDPAHWIFSEWLGFVVSLQRMAGEGILTLAKISAISQNFPLVNYVASLAVWLLSLLGVNALAVITNVREMIQENKEGFICQIVSSTSDTNARQKVNTFISSIPGFSFSTKVTAKVFWAFISLEPLFGGIEVPEEFQGSNCSSCGDSGGVDDPPLPSDYYTFEPMSSGVDMTASQQYLTKSIVIDQNTIKATANSTRGVFFNPRIDFSTDLSETDTMRLDDGVVGYACQVVDIQASENLSQNLYWLPEGGFGGGLDFTVLEGDIHCVFFTQNDNTHKEWFIANYPAMTSYQEKDSLVYWVPAVVSLNENVQYFQKQLGSGSTGGSVTFTVRIWWIVYHP